ncbi:MAG: acyl-CoA reductase [bacterium]
MALKAWGELLDEAKINLWIDPYRNAIEELVQIKKVGIVMAGNIPLVGFHDLLCVLVSGHFAKAKCSSEDEKLIPAIAGCLSLINPSFSEQIELMEGKIEQVDAIIATGTNNTSRYFEHYFGKYPNIIRKNRTGVAILTGKESETDLNGLACDVFSYFGLGCRNVSRLFLPKGYELNRLHQAFSIYQYFGNHDKYRNNLDYFKSISLVNRTPFIDGGFYLMKENPQLESPVSVVNYTYYLSLDEVMHEINVNKERIQCVICHDDLFPEAVQPGKSQYPELWDYADGVDTMKFLCEKK